MQHTVEPLCNRPPLGKQILPSCIKRGGLYSEVDFIIKTVYLRPGLAIREVPLYVHAHLYVHRHTHLPTYTHTHKQLHTLSVSPRQ